MLGSLVALAATLAGLATIAAPAASASTYRVHIQLDMAISELSPTQVPGQLSAMFKLVVSGTCHYSYGVTEACAVPVGTLRWGIVGRAQGGDFVSSGTSGLCPGNFGGALPATATCSIRFPTYGDQEVQATYTSQAPHWSHFSAVEYHWAELVAPVDLGAGTTYRTYDNVGPGAIPDCMLAAAADWVQTAERSRPSPVQVEEDYWALEDRYHNPDHGLHTDQVFGFWTAHAIGGYVLSSESVVPFSQVRAVLAGGRPLYTTVMLPAGFPFKQDTEVGHGWLMVGYSSYGPMVVSWGREFQLPWAVAHRITNGIYQLGVARAPA